MRFKNEAIVRCDIKKQPNIKFIENSGIRRDEIFFDALTSKNSKWKKRKKRNCEVNKHSIDKNIVA